MRERLGTAVRDLSFQRDDMYVPALSPQHYRASVELTLGPVIKIVQMLADQPERLAIFRAELDAILDAYFSHNRIRQSFLMSKATKL